MSPSELSNLISSTPWGNDGETPVTIPIRVLSELVNGKPKPADKPSWQTKEWPHVPFDLGTLMLLEKGKLNEFEEGFLATVKKWGVKSEKQQKVWDRMVGQKLKVSTATEPNPGSSTKAQPADDMEIPF